MWCPQTNTLFTPFGEVGIFLWDIRCIGGLPIIGDLYGEYSPPNSELYYRDDFATLRDLLNAYQWIHHHVQGRITKSLTPNGLTFFLGACMKRRLNIRILTHILSLTFQKSASWPLSYLCGCVISSCHTKGFLYVRKPS